MNWKFWRRRATAKRLDVKAMSLENGAYRVTEAFSLLDGTTYYQFDDMLKIPADRAFSALAIYEEMNMRCTREYLELHCKAVDGLLTKRELGIQDIMMVQTLHNNLKERLALAPHPEFIYKYASVVFMDPTESPYSYDAVYNQAKIEKWKQERGLLDFFLTLPILNLMPHLNMSVTHFKMYLEMAEMIKEKHRIDQQEAISKAC